MKRKTKLLLSLLIFLIAISTFYYLNSFERRFYQIQFGEKIEDIHDRFGDAWEYKPRGKYQHLIYLPKKTLGFHSSFPFFYLTESDHSDWYKIMFINGTVTELEILDISEDKWIKVEPKLKHENK